jgi:hypothetical protein
MGEFLLVALGAGIGIGCLIIFCFVCAIAEGEMKRKPAAPTTGDSNGLSPNGKKIMDALRNPGNYAWEVRIEYGVRFLMRRVENYETLLEPNGYNAYARIDCNPRVRIPLIAPDYNILWPEVKKLNEEFAERDRLAREAQEKHVIDAVLEASKAQGV